MAKINRYNGDLKAFGSNASGVERYPFGDSTTQSDTLDDNINTDYLRGWGVQGVGAKPPKEWMNGALYTLGHLHAYNHQMGVAEWNTSQEYNIGSICNISGALYRSVINLNTGNDPEDLDPSIWIMLPASSDHYRRLNANGDFDIWQVDTSITSFPADQIIADNWKTALSAADSALVDIEQSTDIPSGHYGYSLKATVQTAQASISATSSRGIKTFIEGYDFRHAVKAGYLAVSFMVKATKTGTSCFSFENSGADRFYIHEFEIDQTLTWERKTAVIPLDYTGGTWDYDNGVGVRLRFQLSCGTSLHGTADSWQTGTQRATSSQINHLDSSGNVFLIKSVQVEPGNIVTPFEYRNFEAELSLCQRYIYPFSAFVGTTMPIANGYIYSATAAKIIFPLSTNLRDTPSILYSDNGSIVGFLCTDAGSSVAVTLSGVVLGGNSVALQADGTFANAAYATSLIKQSGSKKVFLDASL